MNLYDLPGPGDLVNLPDFDDEDELTLDDARALAEGELYCNAFNLVDMLMDDDQCISEEVEVEAVDLSAATPSQLLAVVMADPSDERKLAAVAYLRERLAQFNAVWIGDRAQELVDDDDSRREKEFDDAIARQYDDDARWEAYR